MEGNVTEADTLHMARALELAGGAKGQTYPNPTVGCVITNNGKVVGEGFHPKHGAPHAEIFALRAAGQAARGGTAYVTLEPCNHYGRTPPCALALIEAGISRVRQRLELFITYFERGLPGQLSSVPGCVQVVVGVVDPNPLVGGAGVNRLTQAGIVVDGPCLESECYEINSDFMERMKAATASS